jgi:hypothetical protein
MLVKSVFVMTIAGTVSSPPRTPELKAKLLVAVSAPLAPVYTTSPLESPVMLAWETDSVFVPLLKLKLLLNVNALELL